MNPNDYIREKYLELSDREIGVSLGLSKNAVQKRRERMNLYRPEPPVTAPEMPHRELIDPPQVRVTQDGVQHWIIIPDTHVPYHDVKALALVEQYMANNVFDGYLHLGDFMDFDSISSFNENKPGLTEGRRLSLDFDIGNEILDRHQAIIRKNNPHAKFVMLEGNHEERLERYLEQHPVLKGILSVSKLLRLEERGFEWVPSWSKGEVYHIGRLGVLHGKYLPKYHAAKMVDTYGESVIYGHSHDVMMFPKIQYGKNRTIMGQSIGHLANPEQKYMKGSPTNWIQAFCVVHTYDDGHFNHYVPMIFNYQFVAPDGVKYSI